MKKFLLLIATALISTQQISAEPKCCAGPCKAPYEKYYSVDHIFNRCGECCMLPQDFWKYKIFEIGLTKAKTDSPCADTKSPFKNQGDYTVYEKTVTHGTKMLNMTLDMYSPAKLMEVKTPIPHVVMVHAQKVYQSTILLTMVSVMHLFAGETCLDPKSLVFTTSLKEFNFSYRTSRSSMYVPS